VVGVFPEAGISRSFTVRALMPGAVALSRSTGAPVVLVAVWGPQRIATAGLPISVRRGRAVSIAVSPPITVPTDGSVPDATVELGRQLQQLVTGVQQRHRDQPRTGRPDDRHPAHLGGTAPTASDAAVEADVPRTAVQPPEVSAMF
ncbi:MAG: 1-acyl-sn-glycerol-3-phosphate acyltransferase, partial [Nocardioidaceae bacterium]|nr:1-acyl-sn-glycerol-3-phosphate acyltransferase [Nocardioidaceae bacterium]